MSLTVFYALVTGLTALLFFATGLFVYVQNPRSLLYTRCFIFSASVALWATGYFITLVNILEFPAVLWASRISHAFGAFIPMTYLHFVHTLLKRKSRHSWYAVGYLFSLTMFLLCLTPLVVKTVLPKMGIRYYPEWGMLYPLYASTFLAFPGLAHWNLARALRTLTGTERLRLIYFHIALMLAFGGGISLFLLIFNIPFPPYLSVLIILYPPMMAYTILVHGFMDIEVVMPDEFIGSIVGDLMSRRCKVQSQSPKGNLKAIRGFVPLSEMFGYATTSRSLSQGRATFMMEPSHYEDVPKNVADKIVLGRQDFATARRK